MAPRWYGPLIIVVWLAIMCFPLFVDRYYSERAAKFTAWLMVLAWSGFFFCMYWLMRDHCIANADDGGCDGRALTLWPVIGIQITAVAFGIAVYLARR
jgi:hypothetical protein